MARQELGTPPVRGTDEVTLGFVEGALKPQVTTIVSSAVPTFDTDTCNCLDITGLITDITSMTANMTGSPVNFQRLMVRIYAPGTQNITWGSAFINSGVAMLPVVTQPGKTLQAGLEYNAAKSRWVCLATDGGY